MDQTWYRVERRDAAGTVVDWVEVGRCSICGRGVDREFPGEYGDVGGMLCCRSCLEGPEGPEGPEGQPAEATSGAVVRLLQQSGREETGRGQADPE